MCDGIFCIQSYGTLGSRKRKGPMFSFAFSTVKPPEGIAHCEPSMCLSKTWVKFDCFFKQGTRCTCALRRLCHQLPSSHKQIVSFEVRCPLSAGEMSRRQDVSQSVDDFTHHFVLQQKDICKVA